MLDDPVEEVAEEVHEQARVVDNDGLCARHRARAELVCPLKGARVGHGEIAAVVSPQALASAHADVASGHDERAQM